jgi:hypothetical protein
MNDLRMLRTRLDNGRDDACRVRHGQALAGSREGRLTLSGKANRSALMVSAWVVGMPCGKPL